MCFRQKAAYSEPRRKPKMEVFVKIGYGFRWLTFFIKSPISDVGLGSEYASEDSNPILIFSLANETPIDTFLKQVILILSDGHFP